MNEQSKIVGEPRPQTIATVQIKKIGNSSGVILPREVMVRLNLNVGDQLYATMTPEGGIRLTPYDPEFEETMKAADRIMDKYKDTFAALAK